MRIVCNPPYRRTPHAAAPRGRILIVHSAVEPLR